MDYSGLLFSIAMVVYGVTSVAYLWSLTKGSARTPAVTFTLAGLGFHTAALAARGIAQHRLPFITLYESLMFAAWALVVIFVVLGYRRRTNALGAYTSLVAFTIVAGGTFLPRDLNESLAPALRSQWSGIHIASCLIGYAALTLAFGAALGYMLQKNLLKTKRIIPLQRRLPSLDAMDHLAYQMVAIGFPMLTLGIITGSMWAQTAWHSYWSWDPKEVSSLITWLVYAAYLHVRVVKEWHGKWANRLLILGFICVLVTYFGMNLLAPGLHMHSW